MVTYTVSDLRKKTVQVFKELKASKEPFIIFSNSEPIGVLVQYEDFQAREKRVTQISDKERADAFAFLTHPKKQPKGVKPFNAVDLIRSLR